MNDASTDQSLEICRHLQKNDDRIVIIDKPTNEGVDKARFSGLECARGKYIMFIDSDDWLDNNHVVSLMINYAEKTEADYVEIAFQRVLSNLKLIKKKSRPSVCGIIEQPELFDKYFISFLGINLLSTNVCGKLYRRSLIDDACLRPLGFHMCEDHIFNMRLFPFLKRICILNETVYNYRYGGMTSCYNPYLLPDLKEQHKLKRDCIKLYHYDKALEWILVEMKNVLLNDVSQKIAFHVGRKEEIIESIVNELHDPIYDDIVKLLPKYSDDAGVQAILTKDAERIYNIGLAMRRKGLFLFLLKRYIRRIVLLFERLSS